MRIRHAAILLLLLAATRLAAQQIYIAPVTSTPPDTKGIRIEIMPVAYPASENILDPNRVRSRIKCVSGAWGPDQKPVWDPKAVDEFAFHLLSGGVRRIVLDYEPQADNELWRMVYLRVVWRLQERGVKTSLWGCDPDGPWDWFWAGANSSGEVHPVWYQYTADVEKWKADRSRRLRQVRAAWPKKKVMAWLCWGHEPSVDGDRNSPLAGKYVGREMWAEELRWCRESKLDGVVVFYANLPPVNGPPGPFDNSLEPWAMLKEFAGKK